MCFSARDIRSLLLIRMVLGGDSLRCVGIYSNYDSYAVHFQENVALLKFLMGYKGEQGPRMRELFSTKPPQPSHDASRWKVKQVQS